MLERVMLFTVGLALGQVLVVVLKRKGWWPYPRKVETPPSYGAETRVVSRKYNSDGTVSLRVAVLLTPTQVARITDTKNAYRVIDGWADSLLGTSEETKE